MNKLKKIFKAIVQDKMILALCALLLVILVVIAGMGIYSLVGNLRIKAEDFSALKEDEVVAWYEDKFGSRDGLTIQREYSEEVELDFVISQDPQAGEVISDGLTIVISNGADPEVEFELPDFVKEGYTKEEIEKYFSDNKFLDVTYEYEVSDEPKDTVIDVSVSGTVKRGDPIVVTVSAGDDLSVIEAEVPDLTTYTEANAKAWASSNAINLDIEYVFDESAKGTILSQDTAKGTIVHGGDTIKITVSQGEGVSLPNVVGQSRNSARNTLNQEGLKVSIKEAYSSSVKEGNVISMSPRSGTRVVEGSTVTLTISLGPDPSTIYVDIDESYVGKSVSSFNSYIKNLGFLNEPTRSGSYYSDSVDEGKILSHTTGSKSLTSKITYELSLGSYSLNASDFNGLSQRAAQSVIDDANSRRANVSLKVNRDPSQEYTGTLSACSVSGKTVTCTLASGSYIMTGYDLYIDWDNPVTPENTAANVRRILGNFENLSIVYGSNQDTSPGYILSISVNGSTQFSYGMYDISTTSITVVIDND